MSSRPVVAILLGQAKIDEKELVAVTPDSHEKVVGLDVSMDEVFVVHELDAADHLVCKHENGLHGETTGAKVEQVFEGGTQQVHDQDVVVTLRPVPSEIEIPLLLVLCLIVEEQDLTISRVILYHTRQYLL